MDADRADERPVALWRRQADRTAWLVTALERHPTVTWVHTDTAGVDRLPLARMQQRGILLSHARGVHTPAVAEWTVAALFTAAKRMDVVVRHSDLRAWIPPTGTRQLAGAHVLVLGLGSIGSAIAVCCRALGMRVTGVVRDAHTRVTESPTDVLVGTDDGWHHLLSDISYVVLSAPLTSATRGLLGRRALRLLPPHAWIINVARGELLDEEALVEELDAGRLGGAVLDAFSQEPLPTGHQLWGRPNVIVSPHSSSQADTSDARAAALFLKEAGRFTRSEPLVSACEYDKGY
ncbi:MAG: D-2-hydroxyacid dehydrogenase [Alphaproteobacteria bacterium]|nr:D-2-hydroxyacid dehydrogenase [Alphaproteobacteria bacterium]MBU2379518.1 D-2-hydroxyacid dehydrogenase [Alphaproteobacteria bacterium]